MVYVTGDLHGDNDISKLNTTMWQEQKTLTKNDYLIICGDFGLVWDESPREFHWRHWLNDKPFTTLFVDGNHENFNLLNSLPVTEWHGGKVHQIMDNIYHLMRGQVYDIDGKKFFTMGGASSHDKECRTEDVSWWKAELPTLAEMNDAFNVLENNNWAVDYVISHCAPKSIQSKISFYYENDCLTSFFNIVKERLDYKHWYFGHYHEDKDIDDRHTVLYRDIENIF